MMLLFLNSLGTWEVFFILLVALMLFGSKGIPDVVKNLGRGMNEIRNASNEIKKDIQKSALEMRKDLELDKHLQDITNMDKLLEDKPKQVHSTPQNQESTDTDPETQSEEPKDK
ncbi:twin-arginine translocase TatA/TatE family subunit [Paracrocinitomix mangrovi]|uniref:Sec-independent protein translocase subunit TatA/TatB n=1 Tax=Paracrocinitomix mangrovi TaxID=2862509 RepID=UPI001EDC2AF0|nr:twin-arginine translocase TatA/TatE family subunit [Paracrocinitomix mangrovi]UKN02755.1 twin-arginine translocase TatA/TatE family subunit [Paracrocinitomix mangrovi]